MSPMLCNSICPHTSGAANLAHKGDPKDCCHSSRDHFTYTSCTGFMSSMDCSITGNAFLWKLSLSFKTSLVCLTDHRTAEELRSLS
eukprot:960769-Amphidinium_carterae.2